jgi:hypothetical protein
VVIVGVVIVVLVRFGPLSRSAHREPRFDFGSMDTSVEEHRTLADRFAAEGRYAESVRERLRAVVRDLERRELVHPRPGRTVTEIIADVAGALPSAVVPMTNGARIFSDIWYGGEPASLDDDERLREIERQVLDARAGENDGSAAKPSWALPGSGAP